MAKQVTWQGSQAVNQKKKRTYFTQIQFTDQLTYLAGIRIATIEMRFKLLSGLWRLGDDNCQVPFNILT